MQMPRYIQKNVELKKHCTLKIGGNADYFVEPESVQEIIGALEFAKQKSLPYFVIGHGSNLLFSDQGYRGVIIKIADKFSDIEIDGNTITVQSGAWMPYVARKAQVAGLAGLEHTVGIPGNIGGIITMNAGSLRKSISENLKTIYVIDDEGNKLILSPKDCNFSYRQSIFQKNKWIIIGAEIECTIGNKKQIRERMHQVLKKRRLKFPRKQPNCGSVFKSNPAMFEKYGPPGKIIEDLGLKGFRSGDICISDKHANFFVNAGEGSSVDFEKILHKIAVLTEDVGVTIDPEVQKVEFK